MAPSFFKRLFKRSAKKDSKQSTKSYASPSATTPKQPAPVPRKKQPCTSVPRLPPIKPSSPFASTTNSPAPSPTSGASTSPTSHPSSGSAPSSPAAPPSPDKPASISRTSTGPSVSSAKPTPPRPRLARASTAPSTYAPLSAASTPRANSSRGTCEETITWIIELRTGPTRVVGSSGVNGRGVTVREVERYELVTRARACPPGQKGVVPARAASRDGRPVVLRNNSMRTARSY